MKLITRQTLANEAFDSWVRQYPTGRKVITANLKALGPTPNPDEVDRVIGNTSWTTVPSCDECGAEEGAVVRIGEELSIESSTADLCECCVKSALKYFNSEVNCHETKSD